MMVLKSKLVKITVASLSSLVLMGSGLGATRAYYKATSTPVIEEVEKTDKQALAVELATSESYQDMLAKSKKTMKETHMRR